ncbi:putative thiol-specific peroxiredoxin [Candida albicans Ca6]|nr:putative thiol-specific peroxiredoxin [Candida albicans Ca6]
MSFKEGSKFPAGVEFSYIPIQLDDLELINPLKCDVASQLKLDNLLTKLSTTDTPNLLIVSVPGAFTPTCTESHLPPYLENLAKLHDKKIGAIVVLATNDQFVVNA